MVFSMVFSEKYILKNQRRGWGDSIACGVFEPDAKTYREISWEMKI